MTICGGNIVEFYFSKTLKNCSVVKGSFIIDYLLVYNKVPFHSLDLHFKSIHAYACDASQDREDAHAL